MNQNSSEFSRSDLLKMLQDPQTQALIRRLQQLAPNAIQQAASAATHGETERAKELLAPLLRDDEVQKLAKKMREGHGGV